MANDDCIIGVTGPGRGIPWAWYAIRWQLRRLGVEAHYLTPAGGYPDEVFDGFIVSGGNDIDPAIYGGDVSSSPSVDPLRDEFELQVLDEADRRSLPVLGICRGMQLMNVHARGSLIGDLKPFRRMTSNRATLLPRKKIDIARDSLLHCWLGRRSSRVNSLHHQGVNKVGDGFIVSSRDRDGIVQSIENTRAPLRIGVQWHPEYLPQRAEQRQLFRRFVDECRRSRVEKRSDSKPDSPEFDHTRAAA